MTYKGKKRTPPPLKTLKKKSRQKLKDQEIFYSTKDFSELFDKGEEVEQNHQATGRLRGRRPSKSTERGTREMRLTVPLGLSKKVRASALNSGTSVSNWLLTLVQQELATEACAWTLKPGETTPLLDKEGKRSSAFIHLRTSNPGEFAPRVRGWARFCDLDGKDVCAGEMPIRWSSRPEPLMLLPLPVSTVNSGYHWVPNPALLLDGHVTDFAAGEEQVFAFAIKMQDGSCWGWTQESYWHGWRHPAWRLPSGKLRVFVRLLAAGKEQRAEFQLNTEESIDSIVVRAPEGVSGVQGPATNARFPSENLPENVVELFRRNQK